MRNTLKLSLSCALLAGIAGAAQATEITVDWYRTVAPNAHTGGSSYAQWWANAQESVINLNGASYGSGKSAFTDIGNAGVTGMESYVTSFESYNGVYEANEGGTRPTWVYYISNDDGSVMDNSLLASATRNYKYSWGGTESSFWGDIPFPGLDAGRLLGVRADGTTGTDLNDQYVGFIAASGNAWWAQNWTGTLGVDHQWIAGDYMVGDPDRFDKLAQLAAYAQANQDYWAFSINFGGNNFDAPDITVVPLPTPAAIAAIGLGGIAIRRRRR